MRTVGQNSECGAGRVNSALAPALSVGLALCKADPWGLEAQLPVPLEFSVFRVVSWQPVPQTECGLRLPFLSARPVGSLQGPAGRLAAMAPEQLWLGKNLRHVSCCPRQAMIHGVVEKCFVPGPRGQSAGGSSISLHAGQPPSSLAPPSLSSAPSAPDHRPSQGDLSFRQSSERAAGGWGCCGAQPRLGGEGPWHGLPTRVTSRDRSWYGEAWWQKLKNQVFPAWPLNCVDTLCKSCPFLGLQCLYW